MLEIMTATDSETIKKYFICWLIINKPQSDHLHSRDTSIQGKLALDPRVSTE